jgi:cytochrome c oxidase subunit 1
MATYDSEDGTPLVTRQRFLSRYLFSNDHKSIGRQYLWLAMLCVFLGMVMSLLMRVHLVWPGLGFLSALTASPERYAALTLLHGSLMVFFVLTAAPQAGLGNYFLPLQIGANETAFPNLNRLAFWVTAASVTGIAAAFFLRPANGMLLWILSVALFCIASLLVAVNFSVTTIDLRTTGMTLPRLPVTAWAWFINAILSILIFSILLAACALLLANRLLGTQFFLLATGTAGALDSQRLFWFFAQAQVYVAMLPCFGIVTHLLAMFARRPVWKERMVVLALCAVGLFGFCIWGFHMFKTGMNPGSPMVFALLASSLGLPASMLLLSWFGTLWNGRMQLNTSMLFVLGFISLFLSGGLSGIFLSRGDLPMASTGNDFVTGHFHLVMGVAATFAILASLFFWFPKLFGKRLNEPLGKLHFWLTFAGVYAVFMPMHWLGLMNHVRNPMGAAGATSEGSMRTFITVAAVVTVLAQGLFFANLIGSLWGGRRIMERNPWRATTLEWIALAHVGDDDFGGQLPIVYRGAYAFDESASSDDDFIPQNVAQENVARQRIAQGQG